MDDQLNPNDISGLNASSNTNFQATPGASPSAPSQSQGIQQSAVQPTPVPNQSEMPAQSVNISDAATVTAASSNQNVVNDPLLTNKTFSEDLDERWNSWKCLNCGYIYEGIEPKNACPRCGNSDPDKFGDLD